MMKKFRHYLLRLFLVAGVVLGSVLVGRAQAVESLRDSLPSASVTALRGNKRLETAIPVWQIDSAMWRRLGVTDVTSALRRLPGTTVRDYGGAGGLKTVSVRGMGAAHTAVTLDGVPVSNVRGGQVDLSRYRVEGLSTMSLSVGDAPALLVAPRSLGAATLSLSTLRSDTAGGMHGHLALTQASFGVVNPSFSLSGKANARTTLGMEADFFYGENDYPFLLRNGKLVTHERRTGSRMQAWTLRADMTHRTRRGGLWQTQATYLNDHRRLPGQVVLYVVDDASERLAEQSLQAQTRWSRRVGKWEVMAAAKFDWQESRYADIDAQYPGGALRQHYWQRETYAAAGVARQLGCFSVAYAADYTYDDLSSNQLSDNDVSRHSLWQSLSLRAEGRRGEATVRLLAYADRNRNGAGGQAARSAQRLSPSLSASWLALQRQGQAQCDLRIRAFYKELFRVPTFTESYYYHLGSATLRPELTRQIGGGLTLSLRPVSWWPVLLVTADAYLNRVTDRIMSLPYNLYVWRTENIGRVRSAGLDLTFESRVVPARDHALLLTGNYSLQRSADRTSATSRSYGLQLPYTPRHSGAASLAYENPWVNLVVSLSGASERWSTKEHTPTTSLPGYVEAGIGAYRTWRLGQTLCEVRADLLNAFNRQYEVIRRYPMPGRAYRVSLTARF